MATAEGSGFLEDAVSHGSWKKDVVADRGDEGADGALLLVHIEAARDLGDTDLPSSLPVAE